LRAYRTDDLDDLYVISLATGLIGGDASALYCDPAMMGHIYAAPYAVLSPSMAFVVEDDVGVAGYIVGATDTRAFDACSSANGGRRCASAMPIRAARRRPGTPTSAAAS